MITIVINGKPIIKHRIEVIGMVIEEMQEMFNIRFKDDYKVELFDFLDNHFSETNIKDLFEMKEYESVLIFTSDNDDDIDNVN